MSEQQIELETRLIGKEDIAFDTAGSGASGSFVDSSGVTHTFHHLNSDHVPLTTAARLFGAAVTTVDSAIIKLYALYQTLITGGGGGLTQDTTVNLASSATVSEWQTAIDAVAKNLDGHTLTINFPEGVTYSSGTELFFKRFYNGFLKIDLRNTTLSDSSALTALIGLEDLRCKAWITNGALSHTHSTYAIKAVRCQGIYMDDLIVTGKSSVSGSYCLKLVNSDGYVETEGENPVTLNDDQMAEFDSIFKGFAEALITNHNNSFSAHNLTQKAPLASPAFTGIPTVPTASTSINNTQIASTAFSHNLVEDLLETKFAARLGSNGWQKLTTGLIIQWGGGTIPDSGARYITFNFPTTFPGACFTVLVARKSRGEEIENVDWEAELLAEPPGNTNVKIMSNKNGIAFSLVAIGY